MRTFICFGKRNIYIYIYKNGLGNAYPARLMSSYWRTCYLSLQGTYETTLSRLGKLLPVADVIWEVGC
jgi:hypothetical protein